MGARWSRRPSFCEDDASRGQAAHPVPRCGHRPMLGVARRWRALLGKRRRSDGPTVRRCIHDGRGRAGRARSDYEHPRAASLGGDADRPPRGGRESYRCRVRLFALRGPAVRPRPTCSSARLRRSTTAAGTCEKLARGQRRLRSRRIISQSTTGGVHKAARAVAYRGTSTSPGEAAGGGARMVGCIARSGACARNGSDPYSAGAEVDRRGACRGGCSVTFVARQSLSRIRRPITHPLSHRMADAHGRGAPHNHRNHHRRDRVARRLRLRRGVQPSVQAGSWALAKPVARKPLRRSSTSVDASPARRSGGG